MINSKKKLEKTESTYP